jgi:hypothetical protein
MSMIRILFDDIIQSVIKWWKRVWFEAKLKARLDMIELKNRIESEIEREEQNKPLYSEHPIDPVLQTGESQKLGGAMELRAPWYNDGIQPERQDGVQEAPGMDNRL